MCIFSAFSINSLTFVLPLFFLKKWKRMFAWKSIGKLEIIGNNVVFVHLPPFAPLKLKWYKSGHFYQQYTL